MKYYFFVLIVLLSFFSFAGYAQSRRMTIRTLNNQDSVNLHYNKDYFLIEDSCALIVRYGHFNFQSLHFFGKVTDVSVADPNLITAELYYDKQGQKNGPVISRYLNGNLQSKGAFKNNEYDGEWEIFYEDGSPHLTFEADDRDFTITALWDENGKKLVDNGTGKYKFTTSQGMRVEGKLIDGKPDGKWTYTNTNISMPNPLITEYYKKKHFVKGKTIISEYEDQSKLIIIDADMLPFVRGEKMYTTPTPCSDVVLQRSNVSYKDGLDAFGEQIKRLVSEYLDNVDITMYNNKMEIEGVVYEDGMIKNLTGNSPFNHSIMRGIINKLAYLPRLKPATIDGKPVKSKFEIVFVFNEGVYHFSFRFMPLPNN